MARFTTTQGRAMPDLTRLSGGKFLVVGRAGMDLYADPPGTRTEEAEHFFASLGGSSANIAVALKRQGMEAALLTCVSDDAIGRFCLNQLHRYGIDCRHVRAVGGEARNSLAVVESRVINHQSVIYRNGAADFEMTVADVEAVDYASYSALITTGTALAAEPSRSAVLRAFHLARAAGLPLILDLDYRPYSWPSADIAAAVYAQASDLCDILVGNDSEFGVLAGDDAQGLAKARALAHSGAAIVIHKLGEKGAITFTGGREIHTGVFQTKALKPTGAGDSFLGAFVAALVAGRSVEAAVIRGAAAAAIVVARIGCAPAMPTTDEVDRFMACHAPPIMS
jgi:5-dehydro-2-deoxygluconokinase